MPRDGSSIYAIPPGTEGIPDTTIASAKYNGFAHDVETDLNLPRPIVAGGTGASNAHDALLNLGAEASNQLVDNYNTFPFISGSFLSVPGTTGEPVAGHYFEGICYTSAPLTPNDFFLEGRDLTDGRKWVRRKNGGVWQPWAVSDQPMIDLANSKVAKAGDTMTGNLVLNYANPSILLQRTASGQSSSLFGFTGGLGRWQVELGTATAESGGNVGSDFNITRYNDAGAGIDSPLSISRATGNVFSLKDVITNGSFVSNGGAIYIQALAGGNANLWLRDHLNAPKAVVFWDRSADALLLSHQTAGVSIKLRNDGNVELGKGFQGRTGLSGAYTNFNHNFVWTGAVLQAWVDGVNLGTVTVTSDYRIKKDVLDLPGMWDTVKALRPIKYTQAQFTPQAEIERKLQQAVADRAAGLDTPAAKAGSEFVPLFTADAIERWGFVAHELQATLLPTAATGVKDAPDLVQALNLAPVVAALTKALQEAMARVEALEAAVGTTPMATILQRLDVLDRFREKIEAL